MYGILELIVIMFVARWYYLKAKENNRNPIAWPASAILAYYVPSRLFGLYFYPWLVDGKISIDKYFTNTFIGIILAIGLGVLGLFLVKKRFDIAIKNQ